MIFAALQGLSADSETTLLMNRALLALIAILVAVVAYFLKQTADDIKATRETVADHAKILARHGVMYELWLDDFTERFTTESEETPQRRKTDIVRNILSGLAEKQHQREL